MARKFKVTNSPLLAEDLQRAINYYKRVSGNHKLGKRLVAITEDKTKSLCTNALHYEVKYNSIRCAKIDGFPYRIHFKVNEKENTVYVMGLFGTSESPETGKR